ncbi:MAG: hypothetical protein CVT60_03525 [Actinobacteria bacterium HGW-Actinobacteria-10]|nr:MAG: hypothetical protein CVT60_03525 [Actinobacteria bacterium HGW-Actinobacteria-10]
MKRRIAGRFDAPTLILVGVAIALVAAYWGIVKLSEDYYLVAAPPGSVFSSADDGFKILYAYLEELDIERDRLETFDELPEEGTIVVAASQPLEKRPSLYEIRLLRDWVRGGGRLVLVGQYAGQMAGDTLGGTTGAGQLTTLPLIIPSIYTQGVDEIEVGEERVLEAGAMWVTHAKDEAGQVLVSRAQGAGEVVWLSSLLPLSNEGLGQADNARLATLLTAISGPVYFDEYHHGFVKGGGLWERLGPGGRGASLLVMLGLAVLLYSVSRRPGPPIEMPVEPVARGGAYIASLAELYRKAGARTQALESLAAGLRGSLARRYGSVEAGMARHGETETVLGLLGREMDEKQFVDTARRIARLRREVEGRDG